ncbi:hypothetical protein XENTR_v10001642 [Xenopus tropicalis]|nr:hypothetical protein XENTR_v10001642 [Xenopus tropicalis]
MKLSVCIDKGTSIIPQRWILLEHGLLPNCIYTSPFKRAAEQKHSKKFLKALTKEHLLEAKNSGPRLCIDLSMTQHMTKKELSRLSAQIRRLYGSNKKAAKPFWLYLTSFAGNSLFYDECVRMNDGFVNYLVDTTENSFLDIFPLETVVYLTPDSDNGKCFICVVHKRSVNVFSANLCNHYYIIRATACIRYFTPSN